MISQGFQNVSVDEMAEWTNNEIFFQWNREEEKRTPSILINRYFNGKLKKIPYK